LIDGELTQRELTDLALLIRNRISGCRSPQGRLKALNWLLDELDLAVAETEREIEES
jgi:hypothetical protein